jgi:hypothetical protein
MDPVSMILSALISTAANDVTHDACSALKGLIKRRFEKQGKAEAGYVLDKHQEKPEAWREPLKEELIQVGADRDEEILQAAKKLLELANAEKSAATQYNAQITGDVKGFVQENSGTVNQNIS